MPKQDKRLRVFAFRESHDNYTGKTTYTFLRERSYWFQSWSEFHHHSITPSSYRRLHGLLDSLVLFGAARSETVDLNNFTFRTWSLAEKEIAQ